MAVFVPSLFVGSGICLFAGLQFCIFGLIRREEQVFLAFGSLCLILGIYFILSANWYLAESVTQLARIARYEMGLIFLIYPVFVWFLSLYTHQQSYYKILLAFSIIFGSFFIVNLWSPYSFIYSEILPDDPITLPWGEMISNFKLKTVSYIWLYYLATYAIFGFAFYRVAVLWKENRTRAIVILLYLIAQLLAIIHAELIDNLGLNSVYLGELVFLVLVALVSVNLVQELRDRSTALEKSFHELGEETSRRYDSEEKLKYMALHDYLTDLPNRRVLSQQLKEVLLSCEKTSTFGAMFLIDLDNFKMINDSLGHNRGDELLRMVAQRLQQLRESNHAPVRLGGDEFSIIIGQLSKLEVEAKRIAISIAESISATISQPFQIAEHKLVIGAGIGIAIFDSNMQELSEIMKRADMALYHAKSAGHNGIELFTPNLKKEADLRLTIDKGLRTAIENGDIDLYFQPQVNIDGKLIGTEVLSRWQHPVLGNIPPIKFITVAEESGLIHLLGENILWQACKFIKDQTNSKNNFISQLSVNVSPWQLDNPGFTRKVLDIIDDIGVDPACLNLEITESTFMRDIKSVSEKINTLSELGITFSIDDFGTGYSSLAWLKKLKLHELKIDKAFIHDMSLKHQDKLIETMLAIAKHMQLRVVAEGVETVDQRNALELMGCQIFQGFLISQPLPEAMFLEWLINNKSKYKDKREERMKLP